MPINLHGSDDWSLVLRKECRLWEVGDRVEKKVSYASEREEVNERLEKDCIVWSLTL